MDRAQEKIKNCILNKSTVLDLSHLNLTELPNNLPSNLTTLYCFNNNIEKLDNLPYNLTLLNCYNNKIEKLDNLPPNLIQLNCNNNKIEKLNNLPSNLTYLNCYNNKYLHITKKIAQKFNLEETPNYFKHALIIQKICRKYISKKRLDKMYKLYDSDIFNIKDILKIVVDY